MGSCLSKKSTNSSSPTAVEKPTEQIKANAQVVEKKKVEEETVKKEIFVIKHRKSHEIDRKVGEEKCDVKKGVEVAEMAKNGSSNNAMNGGVLGLGPGSGTLVAAPVRTSSCTKEEVDAILIQCGRLSRSSSTGKASLSASTGSGENGNSVPRGRKYSGSKRSYDFDHENGSEGGDRRKGNGGEIDGCVDNAVDDDNGLVGERSNRHRQRHRQSRSVGSPSKGRRRTPSRERDQAQQQQRSGSRERVSSGSGRRVSRSPGRRSESPITTSSGATAANSSSANANSCNGRPGKMVSVPATVSSLAMDKSNNGGGTETVSAAAVKRIQVKRNVGCDAAVGSRTAASPRARSPARANIRASNENHNTNSIQNHQQPVSLSRSNSRKAEQSPYRRNPLGEIDSNIVVEQTPIPGLKVLNNNLSQVPVQKLNADNTVSDSRICKAVVDKNLINVSCKAKEQQHSVTEEAKNPQATNNNVAVNVVGSGPEILELHGVTRSRSSRLSRDLDINPEALSNPAPSYTALLLEDIQNFHQKNNTPAFTLPACVSKACSILEAVADLNSSTSSNLSATFTDDKRRIPIPDQYSKLYDNASIGAQPAGKKGIETKELFMPSEVVVGDDLMEPSFHKYVTVRRGTLGGEDMEEQESSGSNSFAGGQQHWSSSISWEPNSADSTDCWTSSSRSNCREDSHSPVPFQRLASSEPGYDADEPRRRLSGKKRDSDQQQSGLGRGRIGSRGLQSLPTAAAVSN